MHEFQIRVSRSQRAVAVIWVAPHPSTLNALDTVRATASPGNIVEVWRDDDCVHREVIGSSATSRPIESAQSPPA